MSTAVILPVKSFANAKQRLGGRYGGAQRAVLAAAMAEDVLNELVRAALGPLIVVSGEPEVPVGDAVTVVDEREAGQSAAALLGLARARELECERALLVPGDCPLVDGGELGELAARAESLDVVIVPNRHGTGTNGLALPTDTTFEPQFGPDSRARHVRQAQSRGLRHEVIRVPSLELDVDTLEDAAALEVALARFPSRAPRTRAALARATV
ncbi:MAG: 2-phospho-L-lactate guanylyltransferase [Solirubrobacterales bacterium]